MTDVTTTKSDAVVRRLYARGTWKLDSVAHFGGDETSIADMCLLKDANGNLFIPGASIAGAARSFLAQQVKPWAEYKDGKESPDLKNLFGGADKDDTMSALIAADARCVCEQAKTAIRDGVRVGPAFGSAADKAKFDVEVVERDTEFELNLTCIIRDGDDRSRLENLFLAILYAFQQGNIYLGARTRRGYGRGKVKSWKISNLEMDKPQDVMAWLRGDFWLRTANDLTPSPLSFDQRQYFRIEADFKLRTSLLIRSSSVGPNAPDEVPDMTHLHSNGKPVLPGTSFAGAFRHRAALIADILKWRKKTTDEDPVYEMFGPVHKQELPVDQQNELWASRVWIEERLVEQVELRWQDRVAIDRFTGGSLDGALFNEKPAYPLSLKELTEPNIRLRLTLEEPDDAEIGLLLLTLRDFWYGHAALGGETSNGRGTLHGIKAYLQLKCSASLDPKVWKLVDKDKRMIIEKDDEGFLQSCVKEAQNYSNDPSGSRRPAKEEETPNV